VSESTFAYDVTVRHDDGQTTPLSGYQDLNEAIAVAEAWVRDQRGDQMALVNAKASWRKDQPTPAQMETLRKFRVQVNASLTRGEASHIIGKLLDASKKRAAA
jgi:hypothetical protein